MKSMHQAKYAVTFIFTKIDDERKLYQIPKKKKTKNIAFVHLKDQFTQVPSLQEENYNMLSYVLSNITIHEQGIILLIKSTLVRGNPS